MTPHPAFSSPEQQAAIACVQDYLRPFCGDAVDVLALRLCGRDLDEAFEELAAISRQLVELMTKLQTDLSPALANGLVIALCELVRERLEDFSKPGGNG